MNENKNHNKTDITVNVNTGRAQRLFGVALFFMVVIIAAALFLRGCGDKMGIGNLTPNILPSGQTDVFAPPEEPVTGTITVDTQYIELVKVEYREVPRELTKSELDSIVKSHLAEYTYVQQIKDENVTAVITDVITENKIVERTFDYKLNNISKTQWLVGTRLSATLSPFELQDLEPFALVIPKNGKWFGGVSYGVLNNTISINCGIILNRKPKL